MLVKVCKIFLNRFVTPFSTTVVIAAVFRAYLIDNLEHSIIMLTLNAIGSILLTIQIIYISEAGTLIIYVLTKYADYYCQYMTDLVKTMNVRQYIIIIKLYKIISHVVEANNKVTNMVLSVVYIHNPMIIGYLFKMAEEPDMHIIARYCSIFYD